MRPALSSPVGMVCAHAIQAPIDFGPNASTKFGMYFLAIQHRPRISVKEGHGLRPSVDPIRCVPDGAGAAVFLGRKTWSLVTDAAGELPIEVRALIAY